MLLYAGIDEAGYGPMLGPLCVACSVWRVERWGAGDPAPDLWSSLGAAITTGPRDARGRVPIADSKALKLPNSSVKRHPLVHLERGVLAMLAARSETHRLPARDGELLDLLGARHGDAAWYGGEPIALPLASTAEALRIDANRIASASAEAGVRLLGVRCVVVPEPSFNDVVRETGSKAEAVAVAIRDLVGYASTAADGAALRIVCDRQGGRLGYEQLVASCFPGEDVRETARSEARCRLEIAGGDRAITFEREAEKAHLPVALASMAAKLVRELAMMRFNRYWASRVAELKPTAGYVSDARRWLRDTAGAVSEDERRAMVRIA